MSFRREQRFSSKFIEFGDMLTIIIMFYRLFFSEVTFLIYRFSFDSTLTAGPGLKTVAENFITVRLMSLPVPVVPKRFFCVLAVPACCL